MWAKSWLVGGLAGWFLLIAVAGCQAETAVMPLPTQAATAEVFTGQFSVIGQSTPTENAPTPTLPPTHTAVPVPTDQPTNELTNQPLPTITPTPLAPSPTPNPYLPYTIAALRAREYGGGELDIIETLEENETFSRYLFTYPSNGLTIYGYLSVPNEGDTFPVAMVLHGYIPPAEYDTIAYTRRYADALVEAGYFVIHPNFRGYPPSDDGDDAFRSGMAIDVLNLIAIVREQSQDPAGHLRRADADHIHLWGHSMGGGITLRVLTVNNADYLRAAVLYGSMSGDEAWNYERIAQWRGRDDLFELNASPEILTAVSPINHLGSINTPLSIHHSTADDTVPVEWSEDLCDRLTRLVKRHECFFYERVPHTFFGGADDLFMERVIAFFKRY